MRNKSLLSLAIFASLSLGGCVTYNGVNVSVPAALAQNSAQQIEWRAILPPPPATDSKLQAVEMEEVKYYQNNVDEARLNLARQDNDIDFFKAYSSVIGKDFTPANYPKAKALIDYAITYTGLNLKDAKEAYSRKRPFIEDSNVKLCVEKPPTGSSYPSGHSASGWISANIWARIFIDKSDAIYARGLDYGKSRIICGAHYPSDVNMGRIVGDIIFAKLQNDKEFVKLFIDARAETLKKGNVTQ